MKGLGASVIDQDRFFIGGKWSRPRGNEYLDVISPSTEEVIGRVPVSVNEDFDDAVASAREAFDHGPWPRMSAANRAGVVERLVDTLGPRADELTEVQVDEMGSPVSWIGAVTDAFVGPVIHEECEMARHFQFETIQSGLAGDVLITQEPVGVVGAIIPWNGPIGLCMTKLLPALLSGSTIVLKPAPESPLDGYILAEAVRDAGIPDGVVSIIPGGREVGAHLVRHPGIDKVAMTGSSAAGRKIAASAGNQMKRVTLELGGKSAGIVLEDADLGSTIQHLVVGSMQNTGQVCAAISRLLLPRSRYDEFVGAFCEAVSALKVGDPHDEDTFFGPLVASRQRDRVENYINIGRDEGATVALGGGRPAGLDRGWYVEPTVFTDVKNGMQIAQEEIFGPVVVLIAFEDEEDAIAIANESPFGLSGAVFTPDGKKGLDLARRIRTGVYSINQYMIPFAAPFGGYKLSGVGREGGVDSLRAYTETKSICLPPGFDHGLTNAG